MKYYVNLSWNPIKREKLVLKKLLWSHYYN